MPGRHVGSEWRHVRIGHKVIPHKSGVHRVACFALYKRLLRQVPSSPLDQSLLCKALRAEFRHNAKLREFAAIRASLTNGYRTLSLLDTLRRYNQENPNNPAQQIDGDEEPPFQQDSAPSSLPSPPQSGHFSPAILPISTLSLRDNHWRVSAKSMTTLLSSINNYLINILASYPVPKPRFTTPAPRLVPYPGGNKILSRPLPSSQLSGARRIPQLVSTSGFPFLRVKKPQPPIVDKILRTKRDTKQRRMDQIAALEAEKVWAADEDEWERRVQELIRDERGNEDRNEDGVAERAGRGEEEEEEEDSSTNTYRNTVQDLIALIREKVTKEDAKQRVLADKMWEIVKAERHAKWREKIQPWLDRTKRVKEAKGVQWVDEGKWLEERAQRDGR